MGAIQDQLCIYELSTLKERYFEIAREKEITVNSEISSFYFKRLLNQIWPELRFFSRSGLTDIVCSNDVTVDEALRRTVTLGKTLHEMNEDFTEQLLETSPESNEDLSVLHQAAVILITRVLKTQKLDKEYFSPEEVTLESQKNFLDPVLLRFIGWLSSKTKLDEGDDIHDSDIDVKTLAISSDITTLISSVITPKHLGLTVHLHHTFGSKKLIEDLSVIGHTMPYSEIRHFLTSTAVHMSHSQEITPSGGLVPLNIRPRVDGEKLILAA